MASKNTKYLLRQNIVFREEEDGAFLFDPDTDSLHCINKVGASICKLCHQENSLQEICDSLPNEYRTEKVENEKLEEDVLSFVSQLVGLDILKEQKE